MKSIKNLRWLAFLLMFLGAASCANHKHQSNDSEPGRSSAKILEQLKSPDDSVVLVAAHRGDWRHAPENSVQGIKNCIEMGVDIVEIDVRLTKDSALILMHDGTVNRTTNGKGKIVEWTLDSLKTLRLKKDGQLTNQQVPTFEEAMMAAKGKIFVNVDKAAACMDRVYSVLKKTETVNQAVLKGSAPIREVREKYGSLLDELIYMPIVSENTPGLEGLVDDFLEDYKPVAFEVSYNRDDSPIFAVIDTIRQRKSRIWVNTLWESLCGPHDDNLAVDNPDGSWGWVIEHGANIIQTDRPEMLLEYLREKGWHD